MIESFRNALFDGYKTGEGMDPVLHAQFPLAERAARALGLVVWPMEEFEADDALASAAAKYADAPGVERVLLCSPDKDLAQSVRGEKVVAFDRLRKKLMDEEGVVAKFGIPPRAIPAYLALVGDPQDGIPGIPRWGAKSTATVLWMDPGSVLAATPQKSDMVTRAYTILSMSRGAIQRGLRKLRRPR